MKLEENWKKIKYWRQKIENIKLKRKENKLKKYNWKKKWKLKGS